MTVQEHKAIIEQPLSPVWFTRREKQVLFLLAEGKLVKGIADQLSLSTETVKHHLKNIYQKTGAHNKIEALNKTKWLTASQTTTDTNCS